MSHLLMRPLKRDIGAVRNEQGRQSKQLTRLVELNRATISRLDELLTEMDHLRREQLQLHVALRTAIEDAESEARSVR